MQDLSVLCRQSSCVAGLCKLQVSERELKETLEWFAEQHGFEMGKPALALALFVEKVIDSTAVIIEAILDE